MISVQCIQYELIRGQIKMHYSIKIDKQCFKFSSSHFLVFENGEREYLHGHNYSVKLSGSSKALQNDYVIDFNLIGSILGTICDSLDHQLLLPEGNAALKINISEDGKNYLVKTPDEGRFSFPKSDVILLPIKNTTVELLAKYIWEEVSSILKEQLDFSFESLKIEVEENSGEAATFTLHSP